MKKNIRKTSICLLALLIGLWLPYSCSENIDDSNLYTFTGEMMVDHFENNPDEFSSYLTILGMVHPSKRSSSTMKELLSARGNYTCFAPTNDAISYYLDSLLTIGKVSSTNVEEIPDSIAEDLVFNSIIENGENDAYATTDFQEGALTLTNMNDRFINISYGNDESGASIIYVNVNSRIIEQDIEVENGYIHAIDKVLSPSSSSVSDLIQATENTQFFGQLLRLTGWQDSLLQYKDEEYDESDEAGTERTITINSGSYKAKYPAHRNHGYTAFIETDSVFAAHGITDVTSLKQWLQTNGYYSDANFDDDYTSNDNAVNQFVAYHLVPILLTWNRMVIFSNEKGFYNGSPNDGTKFNVNVWEYYETMDPHRRTLKITGIRGGRRLNRHSTYNQVSYRESDVDIPGVKVNQTNEDNDGTSYDNNALNGYYYTIDDILCWSDEVAYTVLNERMRYDVTSLLPMMMTNNCRYNKTSNWVFPNDYFENMKNVTDETILAYLSNTGNSGGASTSGGSWMDYQTEEFNINGIYDFTMKLPPVPYTGTYEIRYGLNVNGNRGMAQVYVGTNPNNLPAVGIPLDLRVNGSGYGWISDSELDDDGILENDKALRNNDYMKGPNYFYPGDGAAGRVSVNCMRKIIFRGNLEAGKTYWIRFKSVLESSTSEFFYDYLEIVPKSVYNGDEVEDIW